MSSSSALADHELSAEQFSRVAALLYDHCGIAMRPGKEGLVRARLAKRLRKLSLPDFDSYLQLVGNNPADAEFREMVDALTTNKTSFLRERAHFDYLRDTVLPTLSHSVRIWSAGCSSGEEPYTLGMLMLDHAQHGPTHDLKILATDISQRILAAAAAATYSAELMADVPAEWQRRYWTRAKVSGDADTFTATAALRKLVTFGRLNLMEQWPMSGPFDAIFCRNVMIYFDKQTQQRLVERYWSLLRPGGHLFVGHSESLTGTAHRFKYVQPAVYVR
ncbi:MAG: protein-glutamate O-methyltransferase CheR [Phycisphaerae bacterium]|nr:protein-glutamate O-methyltransferase CheR [Gemmatimonadaceae bacterium]